MRFTVHAAGGGLVHAGDDMRTAYQHLSREYAGAFLVHADGMRVTKVRPIEPMPIGYEWLEEKARKGG